MTPDCSVFIYLFFHDHVPILFRYFSNHAVDAAVLNTSSLKVGSVILGLL